MKDTVAEIFKTTRRDIILVCKRGVEIGCGEIKLPGKVKELLALTGLELQKFVNVNCMLE